VTLCLETLDGDALEFAVDRWYDEPTSEEDDLLDAMDGPILDIGCGPGRHVLALNRRSVVAMGIDAAPSAVSLARSRGAVVLERSVFGRVQADGGAHCCSTAT